MLLLPPAGPAPRTDARTSERRVAGRRRRGDVQDEAATVAEAPFAARPEAAASVERRGRKWGRRASDRATEQPAGETAARRPRAHAPLVAQLIATALGLEQTRVRRRGRVEEALALYLRKTPNVKPRGEA